ncbi:hypothetical protein Tiera_011 [Polaromonas phage Tiera]|nr:hypothetical protein Tiera_011 [Polaromonas phage Tiera]
MMIKDMSEADFEIWISARFQSEFVALAKMKAELDANAALIAQNSAENQELLELFRSAKGFFKVLNGIGVMAVWIGKIAAVCGITWAVWKYAVLEAITQAAKSK